MFRIIVVFLVLGLLGYIALRGSAGVTQAPKIVAIAELKGDPGRFDGKEITVRGVVEGAAGILDWGGYRISDGSGEILVLSKAGIPATGSSMTVSGTFRQAFVFGSDSYAVIVQGH